VVEYCKSRIGHFLSFSVCFRSLTERVDIPLCSIKPCTSQDGCFIKSRFSQFQPCLHNSKRAVSFLFRSFTSRQFAFLQMTYIMVSGPSSESNFDVSKFVKLMTDSEVNYPTYKIETIKGFLRFMLLIKK